MKINKYKNKFLILLFSSLLGVGCSANWLDVVEDGGTLTLEQIFRESSGLESYLLTCYQGAFLTDGNNMFDPAMTGADEFIIPDYYIQNPTTNQEFMVGAMIASGQQTYTNPYGSKWGREGDRVYFGVPAVGQVTTNDGSINHTNRYVLIQHCNIFLQHAHLCRNLTTDQINERKAFVKAIKAWYYFELVRQYGPVTLAEGEFDVNADLEELQRPRSHVDTCFNTIVRLLDEAIDSLPSRNKISPNYEKCFNQDAALALKARVLLYQASPLFNGNSDYYNFRDRDGKQLFAESYDETKWTRAAQAAEEAINTIKSNGVNIAEGNNTPGLTELNNTILDIRRSSIGIRFDKDNGYEWLWVTVDRTGPSKFKYPRYKRGDTYYSPANSGIYSVTGNVVDLYYTKNGLPINMDKSWNYDARNLVSKITDPDKVEEYFEVLPEYEDVLNAHIDRDPRFYANIGFDRGYWPFREVSTDPEVNVKFRARAGEGVDKYNSALGIYNRTGYWCKKGLNVDGGDDSSMKNIHQQYHPALRFSELYLIAAEAYNEAGNREKAIEYLNVIRERAGIPDVEVSWSAENSWEPSRKDTKEGLRTIIQQERSIELLFEGHRFWDLRRWKTAFVELSKPLTGWNVDGSTASQFYNGFNGYLELTSGGNFNGTKDYFFPIDSDEVQKSNISQTLYW